MSLKRYISESAIAANQPVAGDDFDISINDTLNIEASVLEHTDGSITLSLDEAAINILESCGCTMSDDDEELKEFSVGGSDDDGTPDDFGGGWKSKNQDYKAIKSLTKNDSPAEWAKALVVWIRRMNRKLISVGTSGDVLTNIGDIRAHYYSTDEANKWKAEVQAHVNALYKQWREGNVPLDQWIDSLVEAEEVNEFAPLIGALGAAGGAVARGVAAGAGALARTAAGAMVKQAAKKIDKELFGPPKGQDEYDESMANMRRLAGMKAAEKVSEVADESVGEGDLVRIDQPTAHKGMIGKVVEISPSGKFAYVKFDNGEVAGYDLSTLALADHDDMHETADLRRLAGMPVKEAETGHAVRLPNGKLAKASNGKTWWHSSPEGAEKMNAASHGGEGKVEKVSLKHNEFGYNGRDVNEAEYQGREVKLGKPMSGDVKKYKVYVKDPKTGNVKKVNFGDKNMEIKRDNPERRKNFRARHNCSDKKDRTKAGYWSCRMWSKKPVSKIV